MLHSNAPTSIKYRISCRIESVKQESKLQLVTPSISRINENRSFQNDIDYIPEQNKKRVTLKKSTKIRKSALNDFKNRFSKIESSMSQYRTRISKVTNLETHFSPRPMEMSRNARINFIIKNVTHNLTSGVVKPLHEVIEDTDNEIVSMINTIKEKAQCKKKLRFSRLVEPLAHHKQRATITPNPMQNTSSFRKSLKRGTINSKKLKNMRLSKLKPSIELTLDDRRMIEPLKPSMSNFSSFAGNIDANRTYNLQAIDEKPQKARSKDNRDVKVDIPLEMSDVDSDSDSGKRRI